MGDFKEGMRIFARWQGRNVWFPGTVQKIQEKEILVTYDDGDVEWISKPKLIQKDKTSKPMKLEKLKKGLRIIGNWKLGGRWFPGYITDIQGKEVHVKYDDGDQEIITDLKNLQKDKKRKIPKISKLNVGDRILGNWQSSGAWYMGKIAEIKENSVHIQYDDGDNEWINEAHRLYKIKSKK